MYRYRYTVLVSFCQNIELSTNVLDLHIYEKKEKVNRMCVKVGLTR